MMTYLALLRGINVGGNKKVPMKDLQKAFEDLECLNVKTILNTGNVKFDFTKNTLSKEDIESHLEDVFGFFIPVILVASSDIETIVKEKPFEKINLSPDLRFYVTFLDKPVPEQLPPSLKDDSLHIMSIKDQRVCWYLDLSETGTVDAMKILEKAFGKNITTRNWNTVNKMALL
ncbi:MAG: DUF1697 domain-containing protein [Cytophagaceae bacterium]